MPMDRAEEQRCTPCGVLEVKILLAIEEGAGLGGRATEMRRHFASYDMRRQQRRTSQRCDRKL